jgi:hypothetical protein
MDNFDFFAYSLGIVTGLPWGAIIAGLIIAMIGKVKK